MTHSVAAPSGLAAESLAGWRLEALGGAAGDLHATDVTPVRLVRVNLVERPSVVLGSTQEESILSGSVPEGVDVARRRSGGGAVWLSPEDQVWVDVVLPRGDPLWVDDVGRSADWLGRCWATLGPPGATVWSGPMRGRSAGSVACFAGVGPGEVTVGDAKLVGISQRRTATLARFQCVVYLRWDPEPLLAALGSGNGDVADRLLNDVVVFDALTPSVWGVVGQLLAALP